MYKVFHNVDAEKISVFVTDLEFIDFVRLIVIENEDYENSIFGISDAIEYIEDYCDNLTLL